MNAYTRWTLLLGLCLLAGLAQAGTKFYYYTDAQGTVLAKADAQGNIVASYDYAPYGAQVMGAATSGPTGYTGHVNDAESGLVYMQARYYDPVVGRFLSTDPIGPSSGSLFHFNRYDYANNNPIANIDPTGLSSHGGATDDACMGNMQCISNGSGGGGGARDSRGTDSVNGNLSSQQDKVARAARLANRYGHYKLPSDWTFTVDSRYAYSTDEYAPTTFTSTPSNNPNYAPYRQDQT